MKFLGTWRPDVIWASPPCGSFSVASDRYAWIHHDPVRRIGPWPFFGPRFPTSRASWEGAGNVVAALRIVELLKPKFWWLENPRGGLRTMGFMHGVPGPVTVSYCQYGDTRQKMTDLWGVHPTSWKPKPVCKNGDKCHEAAPRGSRTGTQGLTNSKDRAMVPRKLSEEILAAVVKEMK